MINKITQTVKLISIFGVAVFACLTVMSVARSHEVSAQNAAPNCTVSSYLTTNNATGDNYRVISVVQDQSGSTEASNPQIGYYWGSSCTVDDSVLVYNSPSGPIRADEIHVGPVFNGFGVNNGGCPSPPAAPPTEPGVSACVSPFTISQDDASMIDINNGNQVWCIGVTLFSGCGGFDIYRNGVASVFTPNAERGAGFSDAYMNDNWSYMFNPDASGLHSTPVTIVSGNTWPSGFGASIFFTLRFPGPSPPTVDLKVNGSDNPGVILIGGGITVSWGLGGGPATNCSASNAWGGGKSTGGGSEDHTGDSGSVGGKTYTITCSGPGGSASDTVSIQVNAPPPPTVDIKANNVDGPLDVRQGDVLTLKWTTTNNPTQCTASANWSGNKATNGGTEDRSADARNTGISGGSRTYTITCQNAGGQDSDTVVVNVLPAVISCNAAPTIEDPEPNQPFSITLGFSVTPPNPWYQNGVQIVITNGGGLNFPSPSMSVTGGPLFSGGSSYNATFNNITAPGAGTYIVTFQVQGTSLSCTNNKITSATKPIVRLYGGDAMVGLGTADSSGTCTANTGATFTAFNRGANGDPHLNYAGSGSQLAIITNGPNAITEFPSVLTRLQNGLPNRPKDLTLPNQGSATANGTYGGGGSGSGFGCAPDYYNVLTAATAGPTTQFNQYSGSQTIPGGIPTTPIVYSYGSYSAFNLGPTQPSQIIKIDGDLLINNDIFPDETANYKLSEMPSFTVVVKGNIYVQYGVYHLYGTFIAQPRDDNGDGVPDPDTGKFYSCATGFGAPSKAEIADPAICGLQRLKVIGAVVADGTRLVRTKGTLNKTINPTNNGEFTTAIDSSLGNGYIYGDTNVAESLAYTPLVWLKGSNSTTTTSYDAIISLPPVL